jgi:signal transduction histidine kinase
MSTLITTPLAWGRTLTDLRPSGLGPPGLWASLEWQAREFIDSTGVAHDLTVNVATGVAPPGGPGSDAHGERWATTVVRAFEEMLDSMAQHAQTHKVRIRLYVDSPPVPILYIEVRDDSAGALVTPLNSPASSPGLMGLRERAQHFDGTLRIDSQPGQGTCLRLTMPLPPPPPKPLAVPLSASAASCTPGQWP